MIILIYLPPTFNRLDVYFGELLPSDEQGLGLLETVKGEVVRLASPRSHLRQKKDLEFMDTVCNFDKLTGLGAGPRIWSGL